MTFPVRALLIGVFVLQSLASPHTLSSPIRGRTSSSTPKVDSQIFSPNGTDITSAFRTRVYYEPTIVAPPSELTNRGTLSLLGRIIRECSSKTAEFAGSKCLYEIGYPDMQGYVVYCQEPPRATSTNPPGWVENRGGRASTSEPGGHDPPILAETGYCLPEEICRGGIFAKRGYPSMASCMREDGYRESDSSSDESEVLSGRKARVVVTSLDARMPLKMQKMDVESGASGSSGSNAGYSVAKECINCYELKTHEFAPDTDLLRTQAKLLTTGAAAGIVWMMVMSG